MRYAKSSAFRRSFFDEIMGCRGELHSPAGGHKPRLRAYAINILSTKYQPTAKAAMMGINSRYCFISAPREILK